MTADTDDDGDGVLDTADAFPLDSSETLDTDSDGIGNNADTDDDGDGLSDTAEATAGTNPLVADSDGDTISDGDEVTAGTNPLLADTDGDGVNDADDAFPNDASVSVAGAGGISGYELPGSVSILESEGDG
jgi:hypothetical protein